MEVVSIRFQYLDVYSAQMPVYVLLVRPGTLKPLQNHIDLAQRLECEKVDLTPEQKT